MTIKTMECTDCGESVPYGRLSCSACGALLASVAGAVRSPLHVVVHADPPDLAPPPAPEVVPAPGHQPMTPESTPDFGPEPVVELASVAEPERVIEPERGSSPNA